jgi:peptidoglycan-associated lipoprotein
MLTGPPRPESDAARETGPGPNRRKTTMRGATRLVRFTFGSLAIVLALTGCAGRSWQFWKSPALTETPTTPTPTAAAPEEPTPATAGKTAEPTAHPTAATGTATVTAVSSATRFAELPALTDVRFRPGNVAVGPADAKTLDAVVRWLKDNPGSLVKIEGHSDDLGSPAENVAVGQKRAESVKKYLVARGLEAERISIVSYGSDRPLCVDKTDGCRARNRRAHFLVKQP